MNRCVVCLFGALLAAGFVPAASGQNNDVPPAFVDVTFQWLKNTGVDPFRGPFDGPFAFDPNTDVAGEFDVLLVTVTAHDPDADTGNAEIFFRQHLRWIEIDGYPSPEGGPIVTDTSSDNPGLDGFEPAGGVNGMGETTILTRILIPPITGRSQLHLRGDVDFDAVFGIEFALANTQTPDPAMDPITFQFTSILVKVNPAFDPGNPPAFADAGPDQRIESGSTVQLDASGTFDSSNLGFAFNDPNVFERDNITYSWEWVSGPERVDPIYRDLTGTPWLAEVTLNQVGDYVYRVTAQDTSGNPASSDTVEISVVSALPPNNPPNARIRDLTGTIVVGSIIRLDGTGSSDPDGDRLSFRWRQTDEVGGTLPADEAAAVFQPLSGLDEPISTWQALKAGTYYFRLLVNDGQVQDSARIAVTVVESETAGATAGQPEATPQRTNTNQDTAAPADNNVTPAAGCGGSLLPLAVVPFVLGAARVRKNRRLT